MPSSRKAAARQQRKHTAHWIVQSTIASTSFKNLPLSVSIKEGEREDNKASSSPRPKEENEPPQMKYMPATTMNTGRIWRKSSFSLSSGTERNGAITTASAIKKPAFVAVVYTSERKPNINAAAVQSETSTQGMRSRFRTRLKNRLPNRARNSTVESA